MATSDATLTHLQGIRAAVNKSITSVERYQIYNGDMTTPAKDALLATVTTVPPDLIHASDCAICIAWDGS